MSHREGENKRVRECSDTGNTFLHPCLVRLPSSRGLTGTSSGRTETVPHIGRKFLITKRHCLISELTFLSYTLYCLFFRVYFMCKIIFLPWSLPSGDGHPHTVVAAASINFKPLKKLKLNPITFAGLEPGNSWDWLFPLVMNSNKIPTYVWLPAEC